MSDGVCNKTNIALPRQELSHSLGPFTGSLWPVLNKDKEEYCNHGLMHGLEDAPTNCTTSHPSRGQQRKQLIPLACWLRTAHFCEPANLNTANGIQVCNGIQVYGGCPYDDG